MARNPLLIGLILAGFISQELNLPSTASVDGGQGTGGSQVIGQPVRAMKHSYSSGTYASLMKMDAETEKKLQADATAHLQAESVFIKVMLLATTGWYADDRRPILEKYETDLTWMKTLPPDKAFVAALALARLEADSGDVNKAKALIDFVKKSPAPTFQSREELALYALMNIVSTTIGAKEKTPADKSLDDAETLIDKQFADDWLVAEYLYSAALHCHERKMDTLAAAFARGAVRHWQEILKAVPDPESTTENVIPASNSKITLPQMLHYPPTTAGVPYIRALRLTAECDFTNRQFVLAAQDWLECKQFTTQFNPTDAKSILECETNYQRNLNLAKESRTAASDKGSHSQNASTDTLLRAADLNHAAVLNKTTRENLRREEFTNAESSAEKAIELTKDSHDDSSDFDNDQARINLFEAYWGEGKFEEAHKVAARLEDKLLAGGIHNQQQIEVLLCCAKIQRMYRDENRSYELLKKAIELREQSTCESAIPMTILLWQASVTVGQSEQLHKGCLQIKTAETLRQEAGVLFDPRSDTMGDKQKARFFAGLASTRPISELKVEECTKALELSVKGFGKDDCHTVNCQRMLNDAKANLEASRKPFGSGQATPETNCVNIDEPMPLDRKTDAAN
jgi:hypothetical protein